MMTGFIEQYGALIVLFPLLGAVLNGLFGRHIQKRYGETPIGLIASCSVLLSSMFAAAAFVALATSDETRIISHLYTWIDVGSAKAEVSFLFDALSTVMILIVTGVGFLIHVYSTGYMKNDTGYYRFFSYLNLFVFFMLVLVLSENLLLLFIGWEGVGLCSYLLISFWYEERKNCLAGNKAFIVNRAGDFGFLLGILLLFRTLSSGISSADAAAGHVQSFFSFQYMSEHVHLIKDMELFGVPVVTIICLCLFLGVTGKSAQVPLHVWLPDAMAGPTPVSALIHAATMVTAGVYLIGRLHFLFSMSTAALNVITWTGALTALLGATMGCVQHDIKKVLAYSTVSQLGMMVMAMGVEAYGAGIFHLATHAFFKACLFLGAGSVIIAMHHEQDMHRMGGLRKYMPVTFKTFVISALAISGIPPLSGFFSKDEILWNAWSHGGMALWIAGIIAAALTAFYMTRLVVLVFYGERPRAEAEDAGHAQDHPYRHPPKEPPHVITTPLLLLATLSAVSGFIGIPASLGGRDLLGGF